MREKDFSGAQVWMVAVVLMRSLMVSKLEGRKMSFEFRFVMIKVFEGGVGMESGGILVRSRDSPGDRDRLEAGREDCGEDSVDMVGVDEYLLVLD